MGQLIIENSYESKRIYTIRYNWNLYSDNYAEIQIYEKDIINLMNAKKYSQKKSIYLMLCYLYNRQNDIYNDYLSYFEYDILSISDENVEK